MTIPWSPASWQSKPLAQPIVYPDPEALRRVLSSAGQLPPLVTSWEVESLKSQLAEASRGERFLLQGGDCSESFDDCQSAIIANKLKILLKMSFVLVYGCQKAVIRVGRFAGQYAKPRSAETETLDGVTLPSYRGRWSIAPRSARPTASPIRDYLLEGYHRAALTMNFIRGLVDGGLADLHHPELWNLDFVNHAARSSDYLQIVDAISTGDPFHGDRGRPAAGRADAGRFLHQPRGPAPGLRAGADPAGAAAAATSGTT